MPEVNQTNNITPEVVRQFLLARYSDQLQGIGLDLAAIPDTFDFLARGIIDSLGFIQMVAALEQEFQTELDMSGLAAEQMTILGSLANYVGEYVSSNRQTLDPLSQQR